MIALSKSTTNRLRTASRKEEAKLIRNDFTCDIGQVNFDGKLLAELGGFGKVRVTTFTRITGVKPYNLLNYNCDCENNN